MAAVRAGVHSFARSRSGSAPDRVALEVVAVLQAVAEDHVHHARGRARRRCRAAGPGAGPTSRRCGSGRDRRSTSFAPRRRASSMKGQRWTLELTMLAPQATMKREWTTASGSKPMDLPIVTCEAGGARARADRAVEEARAQRSEEAAVHAAVREQAHVPGVGVGQDRLRAVGGDHLAEARGDGVEGLVPGDRARSGPRPSAPTRFIGCRMRSGL